MCSSSSCSFKKTTSLTFKPGTRFVDPAPRLQMGHRGPVYCSKSWDLRRLTRNISIRSSRAGGEVCPGVKHRAGAASST